MNAMTDKRLILKTFIWLMISFAVVFLLRWGYEVYFSRHDMMVDYRYVGSTSTGSSEASRSIKNVATEKINQKDLMGQNVTIDQKYDMTANLSSTTDRFQEDNQELRQIIKNNEAIIQSERLSGLPGSQSLDMTVGVKPDNFDELVAQVREIGKVTYFFVNKVDKTEEYNSLLAERTKLEKTRDSYREIRKIGGSIQDLLSIEGKVLEVEGKLLDLDNSIGTFSTQYSFCTVNFTLAEKATKTISLRLILSALKTTFFWTFFLFLWAGMTVVGALFGIWIILLLLNLIFNYIRKTKDEGKNNVE